MAPNKKTPANGFMVFTFEWKNKYGKHLSLREATTEAGKLWANMNAQERGPYNEKAKQEKLKARSTVEKLTCTGVPLTQVEKEKEEAKLRERQMKRYIETTVRNSVKNCELENQSYFFIMANYFTKTLKGGIYLPAELSVCEYSLKAGVCRVYHTLIDPGVNIYGHLYEAQQHSETTHALPLPPNAMGEKDLAIVYNDVLNFVRDRSTGECAPVYTLRDNIAIVESVLDFLKADVGADNVDLRVYPIQYLFYILKEATCELGEIEKPKNVYITDAYFERDFFEYQTGIACQFHEDCDRSKYCTQSYVTRWGYMFSDYMCRDIAISLIPGRHIPKNTNLNAIITPAPSAALIEKPIAKPEMPYEEEKSAICNSSEMFSSSDFPALDGRNKSRKKPAATSSGQNQKSPRRYNECLAFDDEVDASFDLNPWNSTSRNTSNEPAKSRSNMDSVYEGTHSDLDDTNSFVSYGRGRGANRTNNSNIRSFGRGRSSRP